MAASPKPDSLHADFFVSQDGTFSCGDMAGAILIALDSRLREAALIAGAKEHIFPTVIAAQTLGRAEYFQSFPNYATRVERPGQTGDYFLSPAVCYHCYEALANSKLAAPVVIGCAGRCFRGDASDGSHLWEFTMREVVFLGSAKFVQNQRENWMKKMETWAEALDLKAAMSPANDAFFGTENRGKKLMQKLKQLKYELRAQESTGTTMAIASFNLHEQFFGSRFNITLEGGSPAFSGCVAFGLERWIMALVTRYSGEEALRRLKELK
jgi:seryl-tRNA synthetase